MILYAVKLLKSRNTTLYSSIDSPTCICKKTCSRLLIEMLLVIAKHLKEYNPNVCS